MISQQEQMGDNYKTLEQMIKEGYTFTNNEGEYDEWFIKSECGNPEKSYCSFANGRPCFQHYIRLSVNSTKGWCGFKERFDLWPYHAKTAKHNLESFKRVG